MPYRIVNIVKGQVYHIYTKSIAGYKIFNSIADFQRIIETFYYYSIENPPCKFSLFTKRIKENKILSFPLKTHINKIIQIIAYCIMPTHIHFILAQLKENGISKFLNLVLKSYSKYFNTKYNRKGPLWEGRFKNVLVKTDEQLLHLTRYIHLNPVSISLVEKPEDWKFSSYREYIGLCEEEEKICNFSDYFNIDSASYKKFVEERIDYQRELELIKHLVIE